MDLNETVCFCTGITVGEIKAAYERGATTVEDIQVTTGAGTHCGGCVRSILNVLKELQK